MCRNIKRLDNLAPPATEEEIRAAALQYVRKISGTRKPSRQNAQAFAAAVETIAAASIELLEGWAAVSPARDREIEAAKARERSAARYARAE
jgi:hypothetical protein